MREGNGSRMASRYVALLTGRRVLPVPEIEKIKGGLVKTKCFVLNILYLRDTS